MFVIYDSMSLNLLRIKNISDIICRDNQNTHFTFKNFFFPRKSCLLLDNVEKCGRARQATDYNIIRLMRIAFWISKVTDTHSESVKGLHIRFAL